LGNTSLQKALDEEFKAGKRFVINWYNAITAHLDRKRKLDKNGKHTIKK